MKFQALLSVLPYLGSQVHAFPAYNEEPRSAPASQAHESFEKRLLFDPMTTPVENSGVHQYIAPNFANGDQRGPCPALNVLANHGYINRNGVDSLVNILAGINTVFGMGPALGGFLCAMGTVFAGNPVSLTPGFSIGNTPTGYQNLLGNLLGLLGAPRGLNGSHNLIEGDSSNTRGDLYMGGDASTMVMSQFMSFYNLSPGEGSYTFDLYVDRAASRFDESIANDPNFYYGPFTGMVARNAGYLFASRLFANYSAANPLTGVLNKKTLKSFYGVTGDDNNLVYKVGTERIPDNWFRTPIDYDSPAFELDLVYLFAKYPKLASIGGNMGRVNSFAGVDMTDLTGGLWNAGSMFTSNNLLCFAFQAVKMLSPNALSSIFSILNAPLSILTSALNTAMLNLSCPAYKDLMVGGKSFEVYAKQTYPGVKKSGFCL